MKDLYLAYIVKNSIIKTKKRSNPIKNWAKTFNRYFTKVDILMANNHRKRYVTSEIHQRNESLIFIFNLAIPYGTWDLSSPTRDRTHGPALEEQNHWTARAVPWKFKITVRYHYTFKGIAKVKKNGKQSKDVSQGKLENTLQQQQPKKMKTHYTQLMRCSKSNAKTEVHSSK